MKKNRTTGKIFEFLTLLTTVIGLVIGTGEFIKNDNQSSGHVLYATGNNAFMAISIWLLIGISCIFMMLCFVEIASSTHKKLNGTTANWAKLFIGRKCASFISLFWIFLYVPIFYSFFSIATTEYLLQSFNIKATFSSQFILLYIFIGLFVLTFFTMMNTFAQKIGKYFQIFGTFIKIIPFLLIVILAIVHPSSPNAFHNENNHIWKTSNFFLATGPILFSFDGFIFACNLQQETKNKNLIFKSLIIGIIIIVIVYVLEAIALFSGTADGSVMSLFKNSFHSESVAEALQLLIVFAILIGMNGNSIVGGKYIETDTNAGLLYNFQKKTVDRKFSGIAQALIGIFWFLILILLGLFVNRGSVDGNFEPYHYCDLMSNVVVIFAFIVYVLIMFAAVVNRFTKKVQIAKKVKFMPIYALISGIILTVFILYSLYLSIIAPDITSYLIILSIILNLLLFATNEFFLRKQLKVKTDLKLQKQINIETNSI